MQTSGDDVWKKRDRVNWENLILGIAKNVRCICYPWWCLEETKREKKVSLLISESLNLTLKV